MVLFIIVVFVIDKGGITANCIVSQGVLQPIVLGVFGGITANCIVGITANCIVSQGVLQPIVLGVFLVHQEPLV